MTKNITLESLAEVAQTTKPEITVTLKNGVVVTVKERLSMEEKVAIIEDIVVACAYSDDTYFNPLKLKVLATLKTLEASTDIDIMSFEGDVYALYDILNNAGVLDEILPLTDYQEIINWSYESAEALIKHRNSLIGVVNEIKNKFDTEEIIGAFQSALKEAKDSPEVQDLLDLYKTEITN